MMVEMMIFAEVSIINLQTNQVSAKYSKEFSMHGDYNSWFKLNKTYDDLVINIMKYNPNEKPGQKLVYDSMLLRVSREIPT